MNNDPKAEITSLIRGALAKHLPNVTPDMLEENGKIYYMNDHNDTYFDWAMNHHLCPLMCFYNSGMGAIKLTAFTDGGIAIDLYRENEQKPFAIEKAKMKSGHVHLLATFLYFNADQRERFGKSFDDLEYVRPTDEMKAEFDAAMQ